MRHQVGRCRAGGAGAGRRLWRPGGGERKGQLCEQGSRKGAQFLLRLAASEALPGRRRGQTQGVTWEEGRQEEGKDRTGDGPADSAHPVLTAEGVPARRGWVGTGPGPVQTLLQPPFGLPELVLVQRSGRQGLPGPQSESALPSPGGGKAVRREGWASEDALPAPGPKDHGPPFTGVAFTVLILLTEEALAVETGHLVPWLDVPEHLHARCVSICRHKLGARGSAPHPGVAWLPAPTAWPGLGPWPHGLPLGWAWAAPRDAPCPGPALSTGSLIPPCFAGSRPRCRTMT